MRFVIKRGHRRQGWSVTGILILWIVPVAAASGQPDVGKILQLSLDATQADWQHQSDMVEVERDADAQAGRTSSKTYQVMMIDGTPYNHLIARDGKPLSPEEAVQQTELLRDECSKRANQSPEERARRVAKHRHNQQRMLDIMHEMTKALDFTLTGEAEVCGHSVYVLRAKPRPGYQPPNREAKVLTAMAGKLWIDQESYQWVRVEAEVVKPVWFGLCLAKVYPGTQFLLEQAPVEPGVWMPAHFRVQVKSTILMVHKDFTHDETYRDYRLISSLPAKTAALSEKVNPNPGTTSSRLSPVPQP